MLFKKIGTSLMCTITMFLLCSTYSYASTNNSNIKSEAEQSLTNFEQAISSEKSHFNLNDTDIISNNLELGDVYQQNAISTDNGDSNNLAKELKKTNEYVSTIKLKDSDKPIGLAYIENENSKWVVYRVNSYNSLDDEIKDYKKDVNTDNPTVIIDEPNDIYAIGSDEKGDNIKIIQSSKKLNLEKGDSIKLSNLEHKMATTNLKVTDVKNNEELTGGAGGNGGIVENKFNYTYLIIPASLFVYVAIFFIISKKRSKYN